MSSKQKKDKAFEEAPVYNGRSRSFLTLLFSRKLVLFGVIIIVALMITAIFARYLAPYHYDKQDMAHTLLHPSQTHLLGTDFLGRDVLSRLIYGTQISLLIGVGVVFISGLVGMILGLTAGYFGGVTNTIIMRFIDGVMAFPGIILALIIASLLGGGLKNVIIALGVSMTPGFARLMRGQVISVKENEYIVASRAMGAGHLRIMLRHILPNCFPVMIVSLTMMLGLAILSEASLSFLGVGVTPPTPAWGAMVSEGYRYLSMDPILSFAPGIAIMLVVFSFSMVGDGLRDTLDPRLRGML